MIQTFKNHLKSFCVSVCERVVLHDVLFFVDLANGEATEIVPFGKFIATLTQLSLQNKQQNEIYYSKMIFYD